MVNDAIDTVTRKTEMAVSLSSTALRANPTRKIPTTEKAMARMSYTSVATVLFLAYFPYESAMTHPLILLDLFWTCSSNISAERLISLIFYIKHYYDLQFSPAVETIVKKDKKNPKRVLRDVKKQLQNNGIGTKSQQALKLQHELKKEEYKSNSKHKKQMDAEQKFKLKQQKKKAKHRGH